MKKDKREKTAFICFLVAAICYYISAIIGIFSKDDNWVVNLCLGSVFLCISSTHLYKDKNK